jgi:hypothetical protein
MMHNIKLKLSTLFFLLSVLLAPHTLNAQQINITTGSTLWGDIKHFVGDTGDRLGQLSTAKQNIIMIILFGNVSMFAIFGATILYYSVKIKEIKQKTESINGVLIGGVIVTMLGGGLYLALMSMMDGFNSKLNFASLTPTQAAALFYKINWQEIPLTEPYLATEGLQSLVSFLKFELMIFNFGLIFFIIGLVAKFVGQAYKVYNDKTSSGQGSSSEAVIDVITKHFAIILALIMHMAIFQAYLNAVGSKVTPTQSYDGYKMSIKLNERIPQIIK